MLNLNFYKYIMYWADAKWLDVFINEHWNTSLKHISTSLLEAFLSPGFNLNFELLPHQTSNFSQSFNIVDLCRFGGYLEYETATAPD